MPEEKTTIRPNIENYTTARAASGAKSQHNGSEVAVGLEGMTVEEVKEVAIAMDVADTNKYDHLNVGQQRMNLGNRIRGAIGSQDKAKAAAAAAAEKEDATAKQKKDADKMPTGAEMFAKAIAPVRKTVDARVKAAEKAKADAAKERAAQAAAKEAAKAEAAKAKAA